MASYFDSSLLLAIVLREPNAATCEGIWSRESRRLSSILTQAECVVTVRRAAVATGEEPQWADERLAGVRAYVEQIETLDVSRSITDLIEREPRLAGCRTLDAVHLATALYFRPHLDEPLYICTLARRLRAAAVKLGFEVRPE
jgi:predicted nucleic acid-binding protein